MEFTDHVLAAYPQIDIAKIGAAGGSTADLCVTGLKVTQIVLQRLRLSVLYQTGYLILDAVKLA